MLYSKEQLRTFLVNYHHLSRDTALHTPAAVLQFVQQVGCIQYDPLDVVGKNHDLVLQSRYADYHYNDLEPLLYQQRHLMDQWDKNMSIIALRDWIYFQRQRAYYLPWLSAHAPVVAQITDYLQQHDYANGDDFYTSAKIHWIHNVARQSLTKAVLECMFYAGKLIIHHRSGTKRYYGLAERYLPADIYAQAEPNPTESQYNQWLVLRRLNSVGVLADAPSDAWLGIDTYWNKPLEAQGHLQKFTTAKRHTTFMELLQQGKIVAIDVDGIKTPLYIATANLPLLQQMETLSAQDDAVRMLAPLDNLLWDRRLIANIFDFTYTWEVYTPAAKRKYGYYVLPLLWQNALIGRIEMCVDKPQHSLVVKNLWLETRLTAKIRTGLLLGIEHFQHYANCQRIDWLVKL